MKKLLLITIALIAGLTLVACKDDKKPIDPIDPNENEKIVLRYAAWNLGSEKDNNIERRMIKAFEAENPNVTIEIIERSKIVDENGNEVDAKWDEFLTLQASTGKLPDVFQVENVVNSVKNNWVRDLSDLTSLDDDFQKLANDVAGAATYDGKVLALPQSMFYFGYFINRTVIENNAPRGTENPTFGIEFNELLDIAKKTAKMAQTGGDGIVGIDGMNDLPFWYSAQQSDTYQWYTYTDEGYNLNSDDFKNAINVQREYFGPNASKHHEYVLESTNQLFLDTENDAYNPAYRYGEGSIFGNAKQAIKWDGSYMLRDWFAATQTKSDEYPQLFGQDIDFIGTPSLDVDGVNRHKVPVILDYIGVGQGTKQPELAYKFSKWMGFGVDGYRKRLEISKADPKAGAVNFAPLVNDSALIDEYFALYPTLTEFKKLVTGHDQHIIESLAKTAPGYVKSRWEGAYDANNTIGKVLDDIRAGKRSINDVAVTLNEQANKYFIEEKKQFEDALKKYYK